jgi:hypothetical protein
MQELSVIKKLYQSQEEGYNHIRSDDKEQILESGLFIVAENYCKGFKLFKPLDIRVPQPNEWFYNFKRNRGVQSQPNNPVTTPQLIVQPIHTIQTTWPGKNLSKKKRIGVTFDRWANGNQYGSFNSDED